MRQFCRCLLPRQPHVAEARPELYGAGRRYCDDSVTVGVLRRFHGEKLKIDPQDLIFGPCPAEMNVKTPRLKCQMSAARVASHFFLFSID